MMSSGHVEDLLALEHPALRGEDLPGSLDTQQLTAKAAQHRDTIRTMRLGM